ncbi:hypothetical protein [Bacillus methanolicus]|uniref:Uncharacterized protein n=1 Tax=Bacillus methanolicus (strain MGA3 / ATCC 53907) TaxID=796606 RepID=I3E3B5_BACMM|nr:hypothetical protein [Bacillus methanolicus]AIE58930.1 hypothetical protein BMMGA3_02300 [Bacillus methanolicus MGA3]EIJ80986.1 hypothetical protein MGA3_11875 [Bacillus methanolicus MGA3]
MFYSLFTTGSVSYTYVANKIVDALVGLVPGMDARAIAASIAYKLKVIARSTDGFSWTDLGGIIVDLARFIADLVPDAKFSKIVGILWDLAQLL